MKKETLFVSFSGGIASAYMCWLLKTYYSHIYNLIFIFANTGLEHENTLIFVDQCDRILGLDLVWLETVTHHGVRKGSTHKVVSFETAHRGGQLFEEMIRKYGIPNKTYPHCNREMKLNPIFTFKESLGFSRYHQCAVGIRADEIDRMSERSKKDGAVWPLISWKPTTKEQVKDWWRNQSFDLDLPEHLGNCKTCWKKSLRKLKTIAKHHPEEFEFFKRMEAEYPTAGHGDDPRVFFREKKSALDILRECKEPFVEFKEDWSQGCLVLEIDPDDIEDECGSSCEAARPDVANAAVKPNSCQLVAVLTLSTSAAIWMLSTWPDMGWKRSLRDVSFRQRKKNATQGAH